MPYTQFTQDLRTFDANLALLQQHAFKEAF